MNRVIRVVTRYLVPLGRDFFVYIRIIYMEVLVLDLLNDLKTIEKNAEKELAKVEDLDQLEDLRIKYLGKKGAIQSVFQKWVKLRLNSDQS